MIIEQAGDAIYAAAIKILLGLLVGVLIFFGIKNRFFGYICSCFCFGVFILIALFDDFLPFHTFRQEGQFIHIDSLASSSKIPCDGHSLWIDPEIKGGCRVIVKRGNQVIAKSKATGDRHRCKDAQKWVAGACRSMPAPTLSVDFGDVRP